MLTRGHKLKTYVKLQVLDKAVQDFDAVPAVWVDFFVGRVDIKPASQGETIEGSRLVSPISHTVQMRWRPGVTTKMRFLIDDATISSTNDYTDNPDKRVLEIEQVVDVDERHRWLNIGCIEVQR